MSTSWRHFSLSTDCADLFGDVSVLVDVVQVEGPVEFFLDRASQENGEAHDKILQQKNTKNKQTTEASLTM